MIHGTPSLLPGSVRAATLLGASLLAAGCATPIHKAIQAGDPAAIRRAVQQGHSPTQPKHLIPYVYAACRYGDLPALKALVEVGADIDAGDGGFTPFQECLRKGKTEMAEYLRSLGAKGSAASARAAAPAAVPAPPPAPRASPAAAPKESDAPVSDVDSPRAKGAPRPDDFALVIGIDEYQSLPKADYGVRDARTVRKHLEALGLPARNIVSLEGPKATASALRGYLEEWLPRNVKPESTLFVYYSGHGAPDPTSGDAYLVPWDGNPTFLRSTAYPLKKLYADLGKTNAKRVIVALDACFSGAGGRSVLAKGARPLVAKVDESVPAAANLTVLAAASGTEITGSLDDQGHGIFTYHFLKGLSDGARTPKALFDYLKPRVQDDARRQNREQSPTLSGSKIDAAF